MTQVQLDLSEEENEVVELYKALHKLKYKSEAIKSIIRDLKPKYDAVKENLK